MTYFIKDIKQDECKDIAGNQGEIDPTTIPCHWKAPHVNLSKDHDEKANQDLCTHQAKIQPYTKYVIKN